ncbi:MAG: O-antigen ligase family protein [Candidatus Doudnabacteria bacterium]
MKLILQKLTNLFFWLKQQPPITILTFTLLIGLFIPLKISFPWYLSNFSGEYSDFSTPALYIVDPLAIALVILLFFSDVSKKSKALALSLLPIFIINAIISEFAQFSMYFGLRLWLALAIPLMVTNHKTWKENFYKYLMLLVCLGAIQSIILIAQFGLQHSLGLQILGESVFSSSIINSSKIISNIGITVRPYGLFPHPNIIGGLLVPILIINLYLLNKSKQKNVAAISVILASIILVGIFLSFSRISEFSALVCGFSFLMKLIWDRNFLKIKQLLPIILLTIFLSILILPIQFSRSLQSKTSINERKIYAQSSIAMIKDHLLIGVGSGQNYFNIQKYSKTNLAPWETQPVHSVILIALSEFGLLGIALILLIFSKIKKIPHGEFHHVEKFWIYLLIIAILPALLFEHYYYTIWPATLIFGFMLFGFIFKNLTYDNLSQRG